MAWKWPSAAKNGASEEWTGFIDQGVTLEGTLTVTGTFRVDGNVKGNIISEQTIILGEGAKVEGQIEGNRVVISGRFDYPASTSRTGDAEEWSFKNPPKSHPTVSQFPITQPGLIHKRHRQDSWKCCI